MTKLSDIKCVKCGENSMQAAKRGAYLERISAKGRPFKGQCVPACGVKVGNNDSALMDALSGLGKAGK